MVQPRLLWAGKTEEMVGPLPHLRHPTRQRPANLHHPAGPSLSLPEQGWGYWAQRRRGLSGETPPQDTYAQDLGCWMCER